MVTAVEEQFLEANAESGVVSAAWVPAKGKPDHPSYWTICRVELEDGRTFRLSQKFMQSNELRWAL